MSSASWVQDGKRLGRELRSEPYSLLLQILKRQDPSLGEFGTWDDIVAFVQAKSAKDPRTDEILRPIFRAYAENRDPRWRTVLLALFWRDLERIHHFKRRWDPDLEALWTNISWAFLQTIDAIDIESRLRGLSHKVLCDVFHRLYDLYRREWNWVKKTEVSDNDEFQEPNGLESLTGGTEDIGFAEVDWCHDRDLEIQRLRGYVSRGLISESEFFLIVGTLIYGSSLAEYAENSGISYETVKKRSQRAMAKIDRLREASKNF